MTRAGTVVVLFVLQSRHRHRHRHHTAAAARHEKPLHTKADVWWCDAGAQRQLECLPCFQTGRMTGVWSRWVNLHSPFHCGLFTLHLSLTLNSALPSVTCGVPVVVRQLHQLVDYVQQVVVVFLQQPLVQWPVPEAHLHQHSHHGVLGGGIHRRLQGRRIQTKHSEVDNRQPEWNWESPHHPAVTTVHQGMTYDP